MEILAPVGGKEQLEAAVRSGANAVYLGTQNFNARRNAENFNNDDLINAIKYCHSRNVKTYVTFNTLITDIEITAAAEQIEHIAKSGADAIIVQDLAVAALIKKIVPNMPIHASTQMTVHNLSGAKILEKLGFCRVVPARELSLKEIENIKKNTSLEIEVFVHGALCMCVSGQCYLSSVLGQRSANRGLCAQPCRLNFKSKNGSYALSLKDLSAIDSVDKLIEIGVDSLKIEGRMKRPEYVAAATAACKQALSGKDYDRETLKAVFSRSGFTNGYLLEKRDRDMFGYRTKDDVTAATGILKSIANSYRNEIPLISVKMHFTAKSNESISLEIIENSQKVKVLGKTPEKAINHELTDELVKRSLEKCGGTQFYASEINCTIDKGLSVSMSELNKLRKTALTLLSDKKAESKHYQINSYKNYFNDTPALINTPELYAFFENEQQICPNVDRIIIDYKILFENQSLCNKYTDKLIAKLPLLIFNETGITDKLIKLKKRGIKYVYAPNLYAIELASQVGLKVMGGYSLNILNSIALKEYEKLGVSICELSFENTLARFDKMIKNIPCGLVVYGKMPLMSFRNCPVRSRGGCTDCDGKQQITDRLGNKMTVLCRSKQYSQLLNPQPIYMGDKKEQLTGASFLTLHFTDETPSECLLIINKIKNGSTFDNPFTRGLYYKEIK